MKYTELYPNMKPVVDEDGGVIRGRHAEPCCVCGQPTEYVEICSEAHFCSEECLNKFYDGFMSSLTDCPNADEF